MNVILNRNAIENLSKRLLLPFTGIEQDWEIEMANSQRLDEFISYYKEMKIKLPSTEKIALTALILSSYDDYLNENNLDQDDHWIDIKELLVSESNLYSDIINYWSLNDESNYENYFRITPLIRTIKVTIL